MDLGARIDDALGVLLGDDLAHVVDLVLCARGGVVEAHARSGSVGFTADGPVWTRGRNPIERQDPSTFSPLRSEFASLRPANEDNHYPFAYDNCAHLFENANAPDLVVVHTPAHNWEERGGHRGEHGSLDLIQSRAPLIMAGAGIRALGRLEKAARMVDVAPTLGRLAGAQQFRTDGRVLDEALDGSTPRRVVAFLCDGTNANVLYDMAAAGEAPNVARLMEMGTTFGHGLIASFPSVTLANHTTALTGVHPGEHGILHNFYLERSTRRSVNANSPETWHVARDELGAHVQTIFEVVHGFTAAINEPVDRGAGYATFDLVRAAGGAAAFAQGLGTSEVPGMTTQFADRKREYGWASSADHLAVQQVSQLWTQNPKLMWINLILPDAANHAGGPYSDIGYAGWRDTDARLGKILDGMDWGSGDTAFMLLADHGMEESDPGCKGDFDEALRAAGIPFQDEGYGFIYLHQ